MEKPAILYDSYCKLCNAEIEYYKKKDPGQVFDYIDIMNPKFSAESFQLTKGEVHKYFHVVREDGSILRGVEAFNFIWKKLNTFSFLQVLYRIDLGKKLLNFGYNGFIKLRPYLPRKNDCDEYCEI